MRSINLLPKDDVRRGGDRQPDLLLLLGVIGGVVVTALLAGGFLMAHGGVAEKQRELKGLQDRLAAIPTPAPSQLQTDQAFATDKKQRVDALSAALSRRVAWDRVLREFSLVLPDDIWLKVLDAKAPTSPSAVSPAGAPAGGAPTGAPTEFTIEGYTYSHAAVARLLTRLQVIPDLVNVQLQVSELTKLSGREAVHFRIVADVRQPGGAAS